MKRVLSLTIIALLLAAPLVIGFSISRLSTEQLIICATTDDAFHIPKMACQFYFDRWIDSGDAKQLDENAGIAFAFEVSDPKERFSVVERLIAIGADPNGISKTDGLTPLNAAILLNDVQLVRLLIDKGADKNKSDEANHLNATDYLAHLQESNPSIDRSAISATLASK